MSTMRKGAQQGANPLISHMAELSRPRRALASFVPFWFLSNVLLDIYYMSFFFSLLFSLCYDDEYEYKSPSAPATIWAITHSQQQLSVLLCWPSSWCSPSRPFGKHGPFDRFVFVVKSVLDWLSGTRESFCWPYSFWISRLWYSAAMPIPILLHVFLAWILLCLAIKREIIGDF
jgi:hypothetical protein